MATARLGGRTRSNFREERRVSLLVFCFVLFWSRSELSSIIPIKREVVCKINNKHAMISEKLSSFYARS